MAGAFFETYVVSEIIKSYFSRGKEPPINYMRDKEGHEVDIVLEQNGQLVLGEVKLGARVRQDDLRNLQYMQKHYTNVVQSVIVTPHRMQPVDRNTFVLPVDAIQ
jgi:predicted AAA+ superfamily ATPase